MLRLLAVPLALAFAAFACGDDEDGALAADADIGDPTFTIENMDNSGVLHRVTFGCAQLAASTPQVFVSDGPHAHTLRLEAEQMQGILAGELVVVTFTDGHEHSFPIQKPETACMGGRT